MRRIAPTPLLLTNMSVRPRSLLRGRRELLCTLAVSGAAVRLVTERREPPTRDGDAPFAVRPGGFVTATAALIMTPIRRLVTVEDLSFPKQQINDVAPPHMRPLRPQVFQKFVV